MYTRRRLEVLTLSWAAFEPPNEQGSRTNSFDAFAKYL
jgi:hypothetical protein